MGMGPRTNIYNSGGDPLTQFNLIFFFWSTFCLLRKADSEKMNKKYFVGDPLMQSSEHSSLSTALVGTSVITRRLLCRRFGSSKGTMQSDRRDPVTITIHYPTNEKQMPMLRVGDRWRRFECVTA